MLLALDTSTALAGIALYDASGVLAESAWHSGREHGAQLMPQIDRLLRYLGQQPADLSAVAVALGPGSWSGLRVALSIAKGIAIARDLPLLGISTLDALAFQHAHSFIPVYPLIRLGRERFASARYQVRPQWGRSGDLRALTLAELAAEIQDSVLFCGELGPDVTEQLRRGLGERARFPSAPDNLRRPAYLAALAWERLQRGEHDDLSALEPIYLGEPVKKRPAAG